MEEVYEQFIGSDKQKTTSNILKGASIIFLLVALFSLSLSLIYSIFMGIIAIVLFISSFLNYVDYEYELFEDKITISKIYNESWRKIVKSISRENVKKVYESNKEHNKKNIKMFYNSNISGLSLYTFELNDNTSIELALNDKIKRKVVAVYASKIARII